MKALFEALRFLSVIPLPGRPPRRDSHALAAYPWAGLILGILAAAGAWAGSRLLGIGATAVLAVVLRILITGGLHLDGLADLADGLGGGRNVERRLAIMADSRLGSFGTLALVSAFALQTAVIGDLFAAGSGRAAWFGEAAKLDIAALVPLSLAPMMSRGWLPVLMRLFPAARPGGMGERTRLAATGGTAAFASGSALLASGAVAGIAGLLALGAAAAAMTLLALRIDRRLGGLTGDAYGALIEAGDLTSLAVMLAALRWGVPVSGLAGWMT